MVFTVHHTRPAIDTEKDKSGHKGTTGWEIYDKPLNIDGDCIIYARALRYGYRISDEVSVRFEKGD